MTTNWLSQTIPPMFVELHSAHFHIRVLCHIRNAMTEDKAKAVVVSLAHASIDYAYSVVRGQININPFKPSGAKWLH